MEPFVIALLVLLAAPVLWVLVTYNKFIKYRNMIEGKLERHRRGPEATLQP